MQLNSLQRLLEEIYEVNVEHDVDDFLITDAGLAGNLDTSGNARRIDEKLLIRENDADLLLSLYINHNVLRQLAEKDSLAKLNNDNVRQYCVAVEGVSHFLYLTWNAGHERSVTLLELELQAEVDKYIGLSTLLRKQNCHMPYGLHQWLFENVTFDDALDAEQLERYRNANHYAAKYCLWLERQYSIEHPGMLQQLRRFYRKTQRDKVSMINSFR